MNPFTAFLGSMQSPLDALAYFDRQEAIDAGADPAAVKKWENLNTVYFGRTKFTRKQAEAVRVARATRKSLDQLMFIEQQVKPVSDQAQKWAVRLALLSVRGNYKRLQRRAKDIVPAKEKPAPAPALGFGKTRGGMRPLNAMGDEKDMAAIEHALRRHVQPDRPAGPQMLEALMGILGLRDGGGGAPPPGVAAAVPRPLILIPLPDYTSILGGQGDETLLGLTDGTTMTGAEFLAQHHGRDLEVALFHPAEGAVNLYRTQRFANRKQRDLARAMMATCPVPDCRHAADNCEIHHIDAWSRGGPTNISNLVPVCGYHNRTNDDDPEHKHRGRIQRRNGAPIWISPRGRPMPNEYHRYGAMHLLFGQ